jgi:TolB-like protein
MAEERANRRLAAILAVDVVGYSRLMERDEGGTLAVLKSRRREVLEPLVVRFKGRVFKIAGDGALVEFGSAVNAVQCAVDLQRAMATANKDLSEDRQIVLRIGVNLGDVMVQGTDLYGDAVNIAARLEALAEPGGILVSGTAHDHVRNKIQVGFDDVGVRNLKNIAEPIRVYRITGTPAVAVTPTNVIADKPSIAVLPFANMSDDPAQQYFSDGITEDIITELSRFRSLLVIARNSSFRFRTATDVKVIGRELAVQYVVEGSVRRSDGQIRITAQLVDAATGNHIWAEHYDRDMQQIFAVQNEVTQAIAATAEGRMAASGAQRSRRKPTSDLAAYDFFLQGRECFERGGDADEAARLFRRAIEQDVQFTHAYAWLSRVYIGKYHVSLLSDELDEARMLARQAISLDESDAWSHAVVGLVYTIEGQHELAGLHFDRAIILNPMDVRITSVYALWLAYTGRGDQAVRSLDADLRRDPFPPEWLWGFRGLALFQCHRYSEAIRALKQRITTHLWDYYYLAASYAYLGRLEDAQACGEEILRIRPGFSLEQVGLTEPFKDPADLEHLLNGLRKAGLQE